jgi:predicted 2-oxoglutarate/Fe(II)-dependent dioxygenase YbiX
VNYTQLAVGVYQYDFPEDLAKSLVEVASQANNAVWKKSGIGHEGDEQQSYRTSRGLEMATIFPFWDDEVRKHTVPAINHYSSDFEASITQDEGYNMLHYKVTNKYDYHADSDWTNYRTVSCLVYLNPSEYEGGETHFKKFDIKVKPEKPALVVFPANYAYLHASLPVTAGEKYILVSWMNDMPLGFSPAIMRSMAALTGK